MNFLVVGLIATVLLALPLKFRLEGTVSTETHLNLSIQYLFFKFTHQFNLELAQVIAEILQSEPSGKQPTQPKKATRTTKAAPATQPQLTIQTGHMKRNIIDIRSLLQKNWPLIKKRLKTFHLDLLAIDLQAGFKQESLTGVLSGVIWSLLGVSGLVWRSEQVQIKFTPDFTQASFMTYIDSIISVSLGHIMLSGILVGWIILRTIFAHIMDNLKRREAYGYSSN